MVFETVLVEQRDGVRYITLNRPDALNALNFQLIDDLLSSLEECSGDQEVRAVVIAGAGRAFCSGDDLKSMGTPEYPGPENELVRVRDGYPLLLKRLRQLRIPVIAKVQGYALGAGCDLVLACDFAIAAEDALFVPGRFDFASGIAAGETLLALPHPPTAIFASNDDMAAATVAIAHRSGLDVPGDLTVCGFDDTSLATTIWPELTTIRQPISAMARAAVEVLVRQLKTRRSQSVEAAAHLVLDHDLVRRQSDAAPRSRPRQRPAP